MKQASRPNTGPFPFNNLSLMIKAKPIVLVRGALTRIVLKTYHVKSCSFQNRHGKKPTRLLLSNKIALRENHCFFKVC